MLSRSKRSGWNHSQVPSIDRIEFKLFIHSILASSSTINSEVSGLSFSVSTSALAPTPAVGGGGSSGNSLTNNTRDIKDTAENSMIRLVNGISNESLMIENRQLNDPDSLWKRKSLRYEFK